MAPFARILTVLPLTLSAALPAADKLKFNQDIRPILSDKCFHCHGPDSKKREADLRLDVRQAAIDGDALVPGKPEKSEMFLRMFTEDPKEHMPPAKSKLGSLGKEELATIKRWIADGAEYEEHWSFVPPKKPSAPTLDALVAKTLATKGLKPQPEADKATLIRRVTFDLTGLPPTTAELEAFLADKAPDAYEKLVDRLLASTRYGERMAVDWLDISRYADSYGFQQDRERDVWAWRDWVIGSFNQNQRFDEFITWQLAGDLLPNATDDQILATAFNRLHQQENEGGSVEEEYRVEYVADRVQTFATAFLGLTFECARCHDHKYDPITHKDYYQLFSLFQNVDEAGLYSFFTPSVPTPTLALADAPAKDRLAKAKEAVAAQEKLLAALRDSRRAAFGEWLKARPKSLTLKGEIAAFAFDQLEPKNKLANSVKPEQPATSEGDNKIGPGRNGQALVFSGDDSVNLPVGNFHRHEPFSVSLWLKTPDVKDRAVVFHRSRAWTDAASRGYELLIEEGKLKWSLIHFWPGNAISIRAKELVKPGEWTHVTVTNDGSSRASGLKLYVNGQPAAIEVIRDNLSKDITGGGGDNIALGERFRDRGFKGGAIDDLRVFQRELTPLEALATKEQAVAEATFAKAETAWSPAERDAVLDYYLASTDAEWTKQIEALRAARAEVTKLSDALREIMVMRELPQPKKAYVLERGVYDQRREEVGPGTPSALPPMDSSLPKNRLGLARWVVDAKNPLTARVVVNRFWQSIFGFGIVKTPEDFGSQAARPVHPEVLDFLAHRFVSSGWDTKALIKTIVMSGTYRQRSLADPALMADDPENDLLARGPRLRLSAEMIRDNALAVAGLLNEKLGGPPVNPYEMSESFKPQNASGGDGVYRRSLYTNWRRTGPPPAMIAFNAPRRAVCTSKRERTDSPLQALVLLNGPQFVEAARVLGEKLHLENKGDPAAMAQAGFQRTLGRPADAKETELLTKLYRQQLDFYQANPAEAAELLKTGHAKPAAGIPPHEAAAAAVLGQALLNHDGSIVKR